MAQTNAVEDIDKERIELAEDAREYEAALNARRPTRRLKHEFEAEASGCDRRELWREQSSDQRSLMRSAVLDAWGREAHGMAKA